MRIDFLIRSLGQGGAERQLVLLASGLARRGHGVRILTFYPGGAFEQEALARGLEVRCIHKRGRWDIASFFLRLAREFWRGRADLIYSYMTVANVAAIMLRPMHRRPVVLGIRASDMDYGRYDRIAGMSARLEAWLSRFADLIIANSDAGSRHATSLGYPSRLLRVVENGFEMGRWRRDAEAGRRFRSAWGIPQGAPLLGLVGRVDPMKGHEVFIQAAAHLARSQKACHFAAVGSGLEALQHPLMQLAKDAGLEGVSHWIPGQEDMVPVYSAFDAIVSASWSEGFSNVIAEAMACGLRPVATDVGDSRKIVGSCGWIVPAGDAEALASAMAEALRKDREARPDPRARIDAHFGVDQLVARTEALMQRVVP